MILIHLRVCIFFCFCTISIVQQHINIRHFLFNKQQLAPCFFYWYKNKTKTLVVFVVVVVVVCSISFLWKKCVLMLQHAFVCVCVLKQNKNKIQKKHDFLLCRWFLHLFCCRWSWNKTWKKNKNYREKTNPMTILYICVCVLQKR